MNLTKQSFNDLTSSQFQDREVFTALQDVVLDCERWAHLGDIYEFYIILKPKMNATKVDGHSLDIYLEYEELLIRMGFITLPFQPLSEVVDLFTKHLLVALKFKINLFDKFILRFLLKDIKAVRTELQVIIKALESNLEIMEPENPTIQPYPINSWINDYKNYLENNKGTTNTIAQFIDTFITATVDADFRQRVRSVLNIYDWLVNYEERKRANTISTELYVKDNGVSTTRVISKAANTIDVKKSNEVSIPKVDYDAIIDKVITECNFSTQGEIIVKRARNICLSCLKNLRDVVDTKLILMQPQTKGGLGVTEKMAYKIISMLTEHIDFESQIQIKKPLQMKISVTQSSDAVLDQLELMPPPLTVISVEPEVPVPPVGSTTTEENVLEEKPILNQNELVVSLEPEIPNPIITEPTEPVETSQTTLNSVVNSEVSLVPEEAVTDSKQTNSLLDQLELMPPPLAVISVEPEVPVPPVISTITEVNPLEEKPVLNESVIFSEPEIPKQAIVPDPVIIETPTPEAHPLNAQPITNEAVIPIKEEAVSKEIATSAVLETSKDSFKTSHKSRVMTPIDELSVMGLVEFRRLSENAFQAMEKLSNKLKLWGQESFLKRLDGITAWRSSPIHQMYLAVCKESLNQNKNPFDVIKAHNNPKEYITVDEYSAIISFNISLRV